MAEQLRKKEAFEEALSWAKTLPVKEWWSLTTVEDYVEHFISSSIVNIRPKLTWALALSNRDKRLWDALILFAAELMEKGEPLPPLLAEWVAIVLRDMAKGNINKEQKTLPRPAKGSNVTARNEKIFALVLVLVCDFGLTKTRQRDKDEYSACDVVAKIINSTSYDTIEGIMKDRWLANYFEKGNDPRECLGLTHSTKPTKT